MSKMDLIDRLAERTGLSRADAAVVVDALFAVDGGIIAEAIARGHPADLGEFGAFIPRHRPPGHHARHPDEGPPPAPLFQPGPGWRDGGKVTRGGTGSTGPKRDDGSRGGER